MFAQFDSTPTLIAAIEPTALFVLGMLVIGVVLLRRFRLNKRSACATSELKTTRGERTSHPLNPPAALTQWEVRMHETARELSGQLDTKIGILQHLIAAAAHEAQRLDDALAAVRDVQQQIAGADAHAQSDVADQSWSTPRLSEPGAELAWLARRAGNSDDTAGRVVQISGERREQILALAAGGYTRAAISNQVGVPLGDVEMILSLPRSSV